MRDQGKEERLEALRRWRTAAEGSGLDLPTDEQLSWIAVSSRVPERMTASSVTMWRHAIDHVIAQVNQGVPSERIDLPQELLTPRHGSNGTGTAAERIEVLKRWREGALTRKTRRPSRVKDTDLAQVAKSYGSQPADEIARHVPRVAAFVEEMLAALDAVRRDGTPAPAGTDTAGTDAMSRSDFTVQTNEAPDPPVAPGDAPTPSQLGPQGADRSIDAELATGWSSYHGMPPSGELGVLSTRALEAGTELTWLAAPERACVTVYRVVAGEDHQPFAPESARLVAATTQCRALDVAPPAGPVRYVQVWVNQGDSLEEAKASQPRPHARTAVVGPVSAPTLREDQGRVIGQWSVPEGVRCVHVFRIPTEHASSAVRQEQYRVCADQPNLTGFVDDAAPRGRSLVYRLVVEALTAEDMVQLSAPVEREVDVSGVLAPVDDLGIAPADAGPGSLVSLIWSTAPGGEVRIYRAAAEPRAGIDHQVHELERLEQMGFTDQTRLFHPTDAPAPGSTSMRGVPWPMDWERMYVTPVTVLQGRAIVGTTISTAGARPVRELRLFERVDEQVLTFGWPEGAASVSVRLGGVDSDPREACTGAPYQTITQQEYRRDGGMRLRLPTAGCRVILSSTVYDAARPFDGAPVVVDYPGLLRIRYDVSLVRKVFPRKPATARLRVWADMDAPGAKALRLRGSPPFVVVHHAERLPLHHQDGTRLPVALAVDGAPPAQLAFVPSTLLEGAAETQWRVDLTGFSGGFIRLFPDVTPEQRARVAVLDPPVTQLRIARPPRDPTEGVVTRGRQR